MNDNTLVGGLLVCFFMPFYGGRVVQVSSLCK